MQKAEMLCALKIANGTTSAHTRMFVRGCKGSHRRGPFKPTADRAAVRARYGPEAAIGQSTVLQRPPVTQDTLRILWDVHAPQGGIEAM